MPASIVLAGALALCVAASSQILPATDAGPSGSTTPSSSVESGLTAPESSTTPDAAPSADTPAVGDVVDPTTVPTPDTETESPMPGRPIAVDPVIETPPPVPNIGPSWGPDGPSTEGTTPENPEIPGATEPTVPDPVEPAPPQSSSSAAPSPSAPAMGPLPSGTPSQPASPTPSASPTATPTPSVTPTQTANPTASPSPSATAAPTASASPTVTPTPVPLQTAPAAPTAPTPSPTPTTPFPGKAPSGETDPDNGALALLPDSNTAAILTVFNAINSYRASLGLAPVKYHATVASLAQDWSNNIATREVIQHRANFWTDPRALNPNNGAGEVIAVRWDRDAAQLVEWWKGSPGHDALLRDPRFNVMGIGITYTDGNWQTTPNRYTLWGVVNFFGYTSLPAGTTNAPGGTVTPPTDPIGACQPGDKYQPPTVNLSSASIRSAADLVSIAADGTVYSYASLGNAKYGAARKIGIGFTGLKELFVSDWDRDGVFDLISQRTDGALLVYPGRPSGGFGSPGVLGHGWQSLNIAVGNWCANNRLPQIVAMDASGGLWLYKNAGMTYIRSQAAIGTGNKAVRLSMVDYNADGFQDLLTVEPNGSLRLYRGSGLATPKQEARPIVGAAWTDYSGLRSLRGVTGANTTGVAGLGTNGVLEYWDLTSGRLTTPIAVGGGWTGYKLAQ
ncbi:CAP domain-containing protein [Paenarthrobacter sp. OM7]|uniref:CAP domain-containing protein n=1 Tax=Paenarthrobacter sp. OM7 TaxID=3041264 RepID=UPI0024693F0E|nr:CAP domain-containing protein [Paenarthrobacter sp. OM7]WGM20024.1 CAP domain-containing protein [Paenarthrobacter sp. OM7]